MHRANHPQPCRAGPLHFGEEGSIQTNFQSLTLKLDSAHGFKKQTKITNIDRISFALHLLKPDEDGKANPNIRRVYDKHKNVSFVNDGDTMSSELKILFQTNIQDRQDGIVEIVMYRQENIIGHSRIPMQHIVSYRHGIGMVQYTGNDKAIPKLLSRDDPQSPRYRHRHFGDPPMYDHEDVPRCVPSPPGVKHFEFLPVFDYDPSRTDFDPQDRHAMATSKNHDIIGYLRVDAIANRLPLAISNNREHGRVCYSKDPMVGPIIQANRHKAHEEDELKRMLRQARSAMFQYPPIDNSSSRRKLNYATIAYEFASPSDPTSNTPEVEDPEWNASVNHNIIDGNIPYVNEEKFQEVIKKNAQARRVIMMQNRDQISRRQSTLKHVRSRNNAAKDFPSVMQLNQIQMSQDDEDNGVNRYVSKMNYAIAKTEHLKPTDELPPALSPRRNVTSLQEKPCGVKVKQSRKDTEKIKFECNSNCHSTQFDLTDDEFLNALDCRRQFFNIGKLRISGHIDYT